MTGRERQRRAAATLRECRDLVAARGSTLILEAVGAATAADWRHYPDGEAYDPATHAQYFYHRHPALPRRHPAERAEHGHFHLFLRGEGMPAGIAPLLLPEFAVAAAPAPRQSAPLKRGGRDEVCHLVAISLDATGEPVRLFTTNRWVTGETWYRAEDVVAMLGRFRLRTASPSLLLNRWIGALVALFEPEIAALLRERDRTIIERRIRWRGNVLEDPRLEIASSLDIDLAARLAAVEGDTPEPSIVAVARRRPPLPPMADGWGA